MRHSIAMPVVAAAMGAVAACTPPLRAADVLTVVTTTTDLKSITESVGGPYVRATSLASGYEDPHFIQAKPSYMMLARKADLWIRIGLELEIGYEELIIDGSRNRRIRIGSRGHLDASEGVLRLEVPTVKVTREMGDIHPQGNPHYWLDPLNARIMAKTIADRLAELAPAHAEAFATNCRAFQAALDQRMFGKDLVAEVGADRLWALELRGQLPRFLAEKQLAQKLGGWAGRMRPLAGRKVVTYHRSWSYFAHRFGLVVAAELEPKPGIPPSPSHLAEVLEQAKAQSIKVVLMEPFYSRRAADFVAGKTGAAVLVVANSAGGQREATDYLALIDLIVARISQAMSPHAEKAKG
jgi:ABC-type Zn uptake system ZnuABC Zn-binding protein ZnuA